MAEIGSPPSFRMRKNLVVAVLGGAAALAACQAIVGIEDRNEASAPAEAGSPPDAGSDAKADAPVDPCSVTGVPPRPSVADDPNGQELVFALSRLQFGIDGGLPYMLNLDTRCTCPAADSCERPKGQKPACDGERGGDNALAPVLGGFKGFSEADLNNNLSQGYSTVLVRVEGYNGKADDPNVIVSIYGSLGTPGNRKPTGTPDDEWDVDEASLVNGVPFQRKYADEGAYVTGGRLVASFDFAVDLGGTRTSSPIHADLRSGFIFADIDVGTGHLTGILAGRWPTSSILAAVAPIPDPNEPTKTLCGDSFSYALLRTLVCGSADITRDPSGDNLGRACDSLSVHIGFDALRAKFGAVGRRTLGAPDCGAGPPPSCL